VGPALPGGFRAGDCGVFSIFTFFKRAIASWSRTFRRIAQEPTTGGLRTKSIPAPVDDVESRRAYTAAANSSFRTRGLRRCASSTFAWA
jgi:hypothetical protein